MTHRSWMTHSLRRPAGVALVLGAVALGCAGEELPSGATVQRAPGAVAFFAPEFLVHAAEAPALGDAAVEQVVRRGEPAVLEIPYADDSRTVFVRLAFGAHSLDAGPEAPVEIGDGVSITVAVEPSPAAGAPAPMMVTLTPSGLAFNPSDPPVLTMSLVHAASSGVEDAAVGLWRQGDRSAPWAPVAHSWRQGDAMHAELGSFSRYALAF